MHIAIHPLDGHGCSARLAHYIDGLSAAQGCSSPAALSTSEVPCPFPIPHPESLPRRACPVQTRPRPLRQASIENAQARRTLLPALSGLLRMGAITLEEAQPLLSRLLEPAASSSGRYTLQDLRRECEALGVEEEPVAASSATTSNSPTTATSSTPQAEETDVPAPTRPGYTRIVEAPRSEVSMSSSTTKSAASSAPHKAGGDWRQAQRTIKPGRHAPTLSHAPVLVTEVDDDEDEQAPGRNASAARTMTTSNAATTTSRATQPVAPFAAASGQPDTGKAGQKNRKGGKVGSAKAATSQQQWFALLRGGGELQELKRLAADPAVLNARDGKGREKRGALFHALVHGRKDVVEWLLQPETGYAFEGDAGALLEAACQSIYIVEAEQLKAISSFMDGLGASGKAELSAFFRGRKAVIPGVQKLLDEKILVKSGSSQRVAAAEAGEKPMDSKVDWDLMGNVLISAAEEGNVESLKRLLSAGVPADHANKDGITALICAAQYGNLAIVRELVKAHASVDQQCRSGDTALIFASMRGHREIVLELLQAGAEVDRENKFGVTALMIASRNGHIETMKALSRVGASVDRADMNGASPLTTAISTGRLAVVQALVEAGASVGLRDKDGLTALAHAKDSGHADIAEFLLKAGAS
jgi:ankyrin repeat protein